MCRDGVKMRGHKIVTRQTQWCMMIGWESNTDHGRAY